MGRRRIASEAEAFRAMDRMHAEGKSISVRAVMEAIGGGSSRTVAAYVRAWRHLQDRRKARETLAPGSAGEAMAHAMSAAWEQVEKTHRIDCAAREDAAQKELDELQAHADALERENESLKHDITSLRAENRVLREQLKRNDT